MRHRSEIRGGRVDKPPVTDPGSMHAGQCHDQTALALEVKTGAENSRRELLVAGREPVVPAAATGAYDCGDRQRAPTVLHRLERGVAVVAGVDIEHDDI